MKAVILMKAYYLSITTFLNLAFPQGVKEHKCGICGREFTLLANMKRHVLIHTNIRAYQCHLCYKSFVQKQTLKAHMIVHSDVKPFKCKKTLRMTGFNSSDVLARCHLAMKRAEEEEEGNHHIHVAPLEGIPCEADFFPVLATLGRGEGSDTRASLDLSGYCPETLGKHTEVDLDPILVVATLHNSKEPAAVFGKPVQEKQPSRISGTNSLLRWVKPELPKL
ncbi:hypothetical protein P7K49_004874 [Saguinus oedipus]|uniref:C2H2-type domain-containing protein n=1 Tax=Saguinus oedipus TaxID=9490 RepID=A0ABQ9W8Q9_SAGOE|nr:hypothetical protein P7K49_004874 [Saguinus oedipus]